MKLYKIASLNHGGKEQSQLYQEGDHIAVKGGTGLGTLMTTAPAAGNGHPLQRARRGIPRPEEQTGCARGLESDSTVD